MIRNDEDGILIQPEDTYSLTRAIEYLADNSEIRLDMGKRAREKVSERFSTKKMLNKYARLFEEEPSIVTE